MLSLLALGNTNEEIAKMLYLSVRTVELVRYAIDAGLLEEGQA